MDFRHLIRSEVDKTQRGLEIGAAYSPILPKSEGYNTYVIDHADAVSIRRKYSAIGVDVSRVETVDAVDDGGEFTDIDGTAQGFDYIVASHVFEHLPDPIGFLQRCERALKPSGRVYLLVPDRRYTFDYLRPASSPGQLVAAYLAGQKRHSAQAMFDHHGYHATRNGVQIWTSGTEGTFAFGGAAALGYAMAVSSAKEYVDCHAWIFTPSSFRLAMMDLRVVGLTSLQEKSFFPTVGCEFLAILSPQAPAAPGPDRISLALAAVDEAGPERPAAPPPRPIYIREAPSDQSAVDAMAGGWISAFPRELGLSAGAIELHRDQRMTWLVERLGSVDGLEVLELGPLEGAHTTDLIQAGVASVLAIEANRDAFLRCLIKKEILDLKNVSFKLGNFIPFLESSSKHWPLIVASGVLYHMTDPLHVIELLAARTDRLYLWTHVIDDAVMGADDPRRKALASAEQQIWRGQPVILYPRPYGEIGTGFCGGMDAVPRWMRRDDLMRVLHELGYDELEIAHEAPDNQYGPALSILARRTNRD